MAVDEQERGRSLTPAERQRMERYELLGAELESRGYRRSELTVGLVHANVVALLLGLPLMLIGGAAFLAVNLSRGISFEGNWPLLMLSVLVLVVVHELIHGITWGLFAERHWRDIEFGFIVQYLTPYCTCTCPLPKGAYITGALMPLVVLGIVPTLLAIASGSLSLLLVGIVMCYSAGGDLLIVRELLRHKANGQEMLIYDHPTQAGAVVFER